MQKILTLLIISLNANAALFPEDGSRVVSNWYYGEAIVKNASFKRTQKTIQALGLAAKELPVYYEWVQDITLLDSDGVYLNQAPYPQDESIASNLTMGVFGDPYEGEPMTVFRGEQAGLLSSDMKYTMVEGGELISGEFSNGESYAIMSETVLDRVQSYLEYKNISLTAREAIAQDFNIKESNLFFVTAPGHIDLFIKAMPGGVIFIHSTKKVVDLLEKIKDKKPIYRRIYENYTYGVRRFDREGNILSTRYPESEHDSWLYDQAALALGERFNIVRVAGVVKEESYSGININFMNSINGITPSGDKFFITSSTQGLDEISNYWTEIMQQTGYSDNSIYFVWESNFASGVDCASFLTLEFLVFLARLKDLI